MFEKLQTGEKIQDILEPAAIRFMLEHLQESVRRSGCFLPGFFHVSISTRALESSQEGSWEQTIRIFMLSC